MVKENKTENRGSKTKELWADPDYRQKMSDARKGFVTSEYTKRKISETLMGHEVSDETRQLMSENRTGKGGGGGCRSNGHPMSEESKQKISMIHKGKPKSKEHKQKLSDSMDGDTLCIHHIDGNHDNDIPENRRDMTLSTHTKLHIEQGDIQPHGGRVHNQLNYGRIN